MPDQAPNPKPSTEIGPAPSPLSIQGLHHVAIIASDIDRSLRFYVGALGFEVIARQHRPARDSWKIDLRHGMSGLQIELFTFPAAPPRPSHPEARGLRHLALRVDDLDHAVATLALHAIPTEPIRLDEATGKRFTFFKDPDALPLELYEA